VAAWRFKRWADEWLAKKKVEKVKRGRIVAVRDPKIIEVLELRVGYVKDRFGKLCSLMDSWVTATSTKPDDAVSSATQGITTAIKSKRPEAASFAAQRELVDRWNCLPPSRCSEKGECQVVSRLDDEQREALLELADLGTAICSSGLIVATLMWFGSLFG
jgi:hypothetical protein